MIPSLSANAIAAILCLTLGIGSILIALLW